MSFLSKLSFLRTIVSKASWSSFIRPLENIRNVAIIAHVDHGKTTLVDSLLRQSGLHTDSTEERLMDWNELERERGITILANVTTITRDPFRINLVDTPGHADFGGEVERILNMVNGVVLVVDATEGPMAQTKFVLSKALRMNLKPIVVLNKIDRPCAKVDDVECDLLDLFMALGATDEQLSYKTVYASAREGWAVQKLVNNGISPDSVRNMDFLFQTIIEQVPAPRLNREESFSMLVNSIEGNQYIGKCSFGLVHSGTVELGAPLVALNSQTGAKLDQGKVTKMFVRRGLVQETIEQAAAGDIITLAGIENVHVNTTICSPSCTSPLPTHPIDPPTMSIIFATNNSPLAGTEGKAIPSGQLGERLRKEVNNNVALRMEAMPSGGQFELFARGELQLGILIETMRREGLEFAIYPPRVILEPDPANPKGKLEPVEEVIVDVDLDYAGVVIEKICKRKGELKKMHEYGAKTRVVFECPTRGLLGYGHEFKNDTRGTGVMNHSFLRMEPWKGPIDSSRKGSIISMVDGVTTAYALDGLEEHGTLFVSPGTKVYGGMIIGGGSRHGELDVNPIRCKKEAISRGGMKDEVCKICPPKLMTIEELIAYMMQDEIIEVTPQNLRLRKQLLDLNARRTQRKQDKMAAQSQKQ